MLTLLQDLRYAFRMLAKNPGFTAITTLVLALGIGANATIFSVVNAVLLRPLPFEQPDQLVMVWRTDVREGPSQGTINYSDFLDWRSANHVFESMAAFRSGVDFTLTNLSGPIQLQGAVVSADLFRVLKIKPILGRVFVSAEDNLGGESLPVVLSHHLWQSQFASDRNLAGRLITLNGFSLRVVGVMPPDFHFPIQNTGPDLWTTIAYDLQTILKPRTPGDRGPRYLKCVARLRAGTTLEQAQAEMNTIASRLASEYPKTNTDRGIWIEPLLASVTGNVKPVLLVLSGAVGFVLLIACADAANLLLVRSAARQKEIAIRTTLGAGKRRIIQQLLAESLLLAFFGATLGLLLARWGTQVVVRVAPGDMPRLIQTDVDSRVLCFTLLLTTATGVLFGLAPAITASKTKPMESLKGGWQGLGGTRAGTRLRSVLVVSQVAVALVLLIGAGLLLESLLRLEHVNPGFDPRNVVTFNVNLPEAKYPRAEQPRFYTKALEQIRTLPGVRAAGSIDLFPFGGLQRTGTFLLEGAARGNSTGGGAILCVVSPEYFRAMGIPLLKGRDFSPDNSPRSTAVVVISRRLAERYFPHEDPVGKRLTVDSPAEIIGVVGDVKEGTLRAEIYPTIYFPPSQQAPIHNMTLVVRSATDPLSVIPALRGVVGTLDREVPISNIQPLEQYLTTSVGPELFMTFEVGVFAGLAFLLAIAGLYGVISYSVAERTHEMGVRVALGACRWNVIRIVLAEGLKLALSGVALGLLGAFVLTRLMVTLLYEIHPTDPTTFAAVSIALMGATLLSSYIPARRATKVDPIVALRYE